MTANSKQSSGSGQNQGEGDRESAHHYNEATREFVKSGKVEESARKAGEQDKEEAERSERLGKERAKEEDPAVHSDSEDAE